MKKVRNCILWITGIILWLFFLILFRAMDAEYNSHTHQLIIIITGICLAIYIWKKTGSGAGELKKENQELREEIQRLQQQLQEQAVRHAIDKSEKEKQEVEK